MVTGPSLLWPEVRFFLGVLAFRRGTQCPCSRFIVYTTAHCIPRQGSQHQNQEHITLNNDSRGGPVVRRVGWQAKES
jgi:hypothetical protein